MVNRKDQPAPVCESFSRHDEEETARLGGLKMWVQFLGLYRSAQRAAAGVRLLNSHQLKVVRRLEQIFMRGMSELHRGAADESWPGTLCVETK